MRPLAARSTSSRTRPVPDGRLIPWLASCSATGRRSPVAYGGSEMGGVEERPRVDSAVAQPRAHLLHGHAVSASTTEFIQNTLRAHGASGWSVMRPSRASGASASAIPCRPSPASSR